MKDLILVNAGQYQLKINTAGQFYRFNTLTKGVLNLTDVEAKNMMIIHLKEVQDKEQIVAKSNDILYAETNYNSESEISKREANDCVVRAMAACLDIHYDIAHKFIEVQYDRTERKGTRMTYLITKELGEVFDKRFVEVGEECPKEGWIKPESRVLDRTYSYSGKRMIWPYKEKGQTKYAVYTVGKFLKENPKGVYFVLVKGHAFTIKDGIVYGNPSDALSLKVRIERIFKVESVK